MMIISLFAALVLTVFGSTVPLEAQRFDVVVRTDFFAGFGGDEARLQKAMEACETVLAENPKHAEALVWHGAGLLFQAGRSFQAGDAQRGMQLFQRGLTQMTEAVALEPDNVAVLIPRGAVLLTATRTMDAATARPMLEQAVADYEKVLQIQESYFDTLGDHPRGELLFGLAEGSARLGRLDKTRAYFERLIKDAPTSGQAARAEGWLQDRYTAENRRHGLHRLPQMTFTARYWRRILIINAAAAVAVVAISGGFGPGVSWRALFRFLMFSLTYANAIGTVMALAMPIVGRWAWRRKFPTNWTILLGSLLILTAAGTMIANVLLMWAGLISRPAFWRTFVGSFEVAAVISLLIGSGVTVYELIRSDLEETTVALRTKERDEAEARRLASEAQLASLESRVQPHFLFNTLNSIAALIPRDPEGAERMTGQLASLMRSSLDNAASSLVPLEQELKVIRDYLDIERVRFGERLRFSIDANGVRGSVMVPRLSLQTLVENSVKYAVSSRRDGATVIIRANTIGSSILLEVEDDGPGFAGERLRENHGLALLKARLALTFGDRARLSIDTRAGRTSVAIELPWES